MAGLDFPIVCPRLIGRDEDLAALESSLLERGTSQGNCILVSGEAGIGKTRLATALQERLVSHGWDVIGLACYEQDVQVPFAGIVDLLNRLSRRDQDFVATHISPYRPALSSLLPGPDQEPAPAASTGTLHNERERINVALHQLLLGIARERPCLLLVEDLHWCDGNTLSVLLFLARNLGNDGLSLLMTIRPDDATPNVQSFLADLVRERLSSELRLKPLTLSQTDEMLRSIFSAPRSTGIDLLHRLYQMTEGNPFYVEEVLRSVVRNVSTPELSNLRLEQARVPRTVLEAVAHRIESLSAPARSLVEVAAVIGVRFSISDLQSIAGIEEAIVLAALRELVQCQLITEDEDGAFSFRHALTREAVASRLLKREKAILHQRIASYLESLPDAVEHPEDLSYHFFEAADWECAQTYAELAGARAIAMFAPAIALEHFGRAIEAAARAGRQASGATYRGRASAFEALGDFDHAREDLEHAIAIAEQDRGLPALVDCLLDTGLLWSSRDYTRTLDYYTRAVEVARELGDQPRLARSLSRLANGLSNTGSFDTDLCYLQEALEIQRAQQDRHAIAETLDLIGMTGLMSGRFSESLAAYREALNLMEVSVDRRNRVSVLASIPVLSGTLQSALLTPALSLLDARPYAEEAVSQARQLGVPSDLSYTLWQYGFWLGPQGRYSEAFAAAAESLRLALETGHKQWEAAAHALLGALFCDILQPAEAQAQLHRALELSQEINSPLWVAQMSNLLVDALLLDGRTDEAVALLESEATPKATTPPGSMMDVWLLSARAHVAFAQGHLEHVLRSIEAITETRRPGLTLERLLGLRAIRLGALNEARVILRRVATSAEEQGNRSVQWRALCDLSHCLMEAGTREQARETATQAIEVIDLIASSLDQPESFRRAATLRLPAVLRDRPARSRPSVLTTRELEIAALIAEGRTNREIADRLVLSSRTVETHVANALTRLGFNSRSQLSAWFTQHFPPTT